MYQRDRQIVPDFDGTEGLFLRYSKDDFLDGQLGVDAIRFPTTSVNRGLLSEPEDALFHGDGQYNGLGVVGFSVADLPGQIYQQDGPAYVFFMRHVPLPENYSHSEIWSDQEPATGTYRKPSRTVRLEFRVLLCKRITREKILIPAV